MSPSTAFLPPPLLAPCPPTRAFPSARRPSRLPRLAPRASVYSSGTSAASVFARVRPEFLAAQTFVRLVPLGLRLHPFRHVPLADARIHVAVSDAKEPEEFSADVFDESTRLIGSDPGEIDVSVVVAPWWNEGEDEFRKIVKFLAKELEDYDMINNGPEDYGINEDDIMKELGLDKDNLPASDSDDEDDDDDDHDDDGLLDNKPPTIADTAPLPRPTRANDTGYSPRARQGSPAASPADAFGTAFESDTVRAELDGEESDGYDEDEVVTFVLGRHPEWAVGFDAEDGGDLARFEKWAPYPLVVMLRKVDMGDSETVAMMMGPGATLAKELQQENDAILRVMEREKLYDIVEECYSFRKDVQAKSG